MNTKRFLHYFLSMTMVASLLFMASCGTEDDPISEFDEPSLLIGGEDADATEFNEGDIIDLTFDFAAPEGLSSFNAIYMVNGAPIDTIYVHPEDLGFQGGEEEGSFSYSLEVPEGLAGQDVVVNFQLVDLQDQVADVNYEFTVNDAPLEEYQTVLLGGQLHEAEPSFFDAVEGQRMTYTEANQNPDEVDFVYYYVKSVASGTAPEATIGAPANQETRATWAATETTSGSKLPLSAEMDNETMFKRVTTMAYEEIDTYAELVNAFVENQNEVDSRITNLQEGEVFSFELDEERGGGYGVVEVVSIEGEFGAERTITLNVKAQPTDGVE